MSHNQPGSGNARGERNTPAWIAAAGAVVAALLAGLFTLIPHGSTPPASSGQQNSGTPGSPVSPTDSPDPLGTGTIWLDQLTPTSGVVMKSNAAPATTKGPLSPLPHELLISPAVNDNDVTFALGGKYKTLDLKVATIGRAAASAGTVLDVYLDGNSNPVVNQIFDPGKTAPQEWIIDVPGAMELQMYFGNENDVAGTALLVSGSLS